MGAFALFSYCDHADPKLIVADYDLLPWRPAILQAVASRLDGLCEEAVARAPNLYQAAPGALLHVPEQLSDEASRAMVTAFVPRFSRPDLGRRLINVKAIPVEHLADPTRLILNASTHVSIGKVRLSAAAIERSRSIPLLGALTVLPGEDVLGNALRVAALLGIGQLDDARRPKPAAQVQFA
jgi:hypothetical protein